MEDRRKIYHQASELIVDGSDAKKEILLCIHEAKYTIRIRMYMWRDDTAGNMILRALCHKAKLFPSIQIYIEKDAFGSLVYNLQKFISFGKKSGDIFSSGRGAELIKNMSNIHLSYVGSRWPIRFKDLIENDHSKVFVFDEFTPRSHALIGGMNISDQYLSGLNDRGVSTEYWHDYMVKLDGNLANRIVEKKSHRRGLVKALQKSIEIFMTLRNRFSMRNHILGELSSAKKMITIEHGYLTDGLIIRRLRKLSRRGIIIRVIFPDYSDGVWHANMHSAYKLLKPSTLVHRTLSDIQIFLYPGMIHAKVILIDTSVAIIGSANLTYGSFDIFHETNVIFRQERGVIDMLSSQLEKDIGQSTQLSFATIPSYSRTLAFFERIFI